MVWEREESVKQIELGLGTIGRLKILRLLAKEKTKFHTIYGIEKYTGLKRKDIKDNLSKLISIGWVVEYESANKTYKINEKNDTVSRLIQFFIETGYI